MSSHPPSITDSPPAFPRTSAFAGQIWEALGGDASALSHLRVNGEGDLSAPFPVLDFAAATFGVAGLAVSELLKAAGHEAPEVHVDRRAAAAWFDFPVAPTRFIDTPARHGIHQKWMAEFRTADDRWIRVQASYPTLRERLLAALGVDGSFDHVADAISRLNAEEAEQRLSNAGAAAAVARTLAEWRVHPQGQAVAGEPIAARTFTRSRAVSWAPTVGRPLLGIRVLDLTRVVAAPMATRMLAALGAEVLRIDASDSDEVKMMGANDIVLGKRWAFLNLKTEAGSDRFRQLLAGADIIVHGYRPGALENLGFGEDVRAEISPGLVDVTLNAYGWTGPWRNRRGFDTLVQYSSGIADRVSEWANEDPDGRLPLNALGHHVDASRPRHLPVEALDFGTGYQLAAAAIRGLTHRLRSGEGSITKLSLARTAKLLTDNSFSPTGQTFTLPYEEAPIEEGVYEMGGRPSNRLAFPVTIDGAPFFWDRPAEEAGSSAPVWATTRPVRLP
jgi:hypothetical protein